MSMIWPPKSPEGGLRVVYNMKQILNNSKLKPPLRGGLEGLNE